MYQNKNTEITLAPAEILENAVAWPDGAPVVSMDTTLGTRGKQYDFNPHEYSRLLMESGVTRAPKAIEFKNERIESSLGRSDGQWEYGTAQIYVDDDVKVTNNTTLHETKHFIQDELNEPKTPLEHSRRRARIVKVASSIGLIGLTSATHKAGIGGGVGETAGSIIGTGAMFSAIKGVIAPRQFSNPGVFSRYIEYRTRKHERSAHKFARKNNDNYKVFTSKDL